jgi:hypothetical protein
MLKRATNDLFSQIAELTPILIHVLSVTHILSALYILS